MFKYDLIDNKDASTVFFHLNNNLNILNMRIYINEILFLKDPNGVIEELFRIKEMKKPILMIDWLKDKEREYIDNIVKPLFD